MWSKWLVCPLTRERVKPALITGVILFLFSHLMHKAFFLLGIPEAANFLDDFAIAILGALLLVFYISSTIMQQNYQRAKERMFLIAEINERVRNALTAIQRSTTVHDERERARLAG